MSMNANVLPRPGLIGSTADVAMPTHAGNADTRGWNPEGFAREQIQSLIQRVFFANTGSMVKQVVFSAAEPDTDLAAICDQVGYALALETSADIAVVSQNASAVAVSRDHVARDYSGCTQIKPRSIRTAHNLWQVSESTLRELCPEAARTRYWAWALEELRSDFEYSVIQAPAARVSSDWALLGQITDGIILVIEAHSTRRATARKIKETLESTQSRILGTVLSERRFPVPESIYRRL